VRRRPPLDVAAREGSERNAKATGVFVSTGPLRPGERPVVNAVVDGTRQLLQSVAAAKLASAAESALSLRLPLVASLSSAGPSPNDDIGALDAWGRVSKAFARCSGVVPLVCVADGPLLSAPAFLLGLADAVILTASSLVYVSGPAAVAEMTGVQVRPEELGGQHVHLARSGTATLAALDGSEAVELASKFLSYLPSHADELPPFVLSGDPPGRATPELREVVPDRPTGSYDVRRVIASVADRGEFLELRPAWAPQLVTALARVGGLAVGVVANQPQSMSGTLDIAASQKGARFVSMCDSFNLPLLTLVDTSGFMPGKDLEWRGIIRHGAELVFAYAEATVPRVCLVLRKAYGGAYIVMDSKAMGNDVCLAWPSAELAVMGAEGAVSVLHRRASAQERARLVEDYEQRFLNPYVAAERGYVDAVIDPADTRRELCRWLLALQSKREPLVARRHGNSPL
jgi:acetyl-CoA carboxylase carboxyltransferase component